MPRKKRPSIARLDQVRISRSGEDAIIEFLDHSIATTHFTIGPRVQDMTDEEILVLFNQVIAAQVRHRDELGEYVAVEVPVGSPQVDRHPKTVNEWSPRGGVLRCVIEDGGGEDGSLPVIYVDDQEFSWDDFGKKVCDKSGITHHETLLSRRDGLVGLVGFGRRSIHVSVRWAG